MNINDYQSYKVLPKYTLLYFLKIVEPKLYRYRIML